MCRVSPLFHKITLSFRLKTCREEHHLDSLHSENSGPQPSAKVAAQSFGHRAVRGTTKYVAFVCMCQFVLSLKHLLNNSVFAEYYHSKQYLPTCIQTYLSKRIRAEWFIHFHYTVACINYVHAIICLVCPAFCLLVSNMTFMLASSWCHLYHFTGCWDVF